MFVLVFALNFLANQILVIHKDHTSILIVKGHKDGGK